MYSRLWGNPERKSNRVPFLLPKNLALERFHYFPAIPFNIYVTILEAKNGFERFLEKSRSWNSSHGKSVIIGILNVY